MDWAKIASASARLYPPQALREKVARYRSADVEVLLAGDFLELAVCRGSPTRSSRRPS